MIKIPRKQSYSPFWLSVIIFFLLLIILPLYLTAHLKLLPVKTTAIFYLINIPLALYFLKKNSYVKERLQLQLQEFREKINILSNQNSRLLKNKFSLEEKITRYYDLKNILEEVNHNLSLESIADNLTATAFLSIANNKGACLLYLTDNNSSTNLGLFKTKKEDKRLVIKAKEGDIFDLWVLRHLQPLFVEDAKKDFRFDLEKLETEGARHVLSLISSPLISNHNFFGILRLDSALARFYSQDDLRFLTTICDFGAVALESGRYFEKMRDLAIHDTLTSLYAKGYFLKRLKEEHQRSVRQNAPFSLLMLDIDYFKNYNDKFGHIAGDIVLKELSSITAEFLKDIKPIISRFGGEEFCAILPHMDKQKAFTTAEELRKRVENAKIILRRQETGVTVSIGVASFPVDAREEDELLLKADRAMYEAKRSGRNRVVLCQP